MPTNISKTLKSDQFIYTIYSDDEQAGPELEDNSSDSGDSNVFDPDFRWEEVDYSQTHNLGDSSASGVIPIDTEPVELEKIIQDLREKNTRTPISRKLEEQKTLVARNDASNENDEEEGDVAGDAESIVMPQAHPADLAQSSQDSDEEGEDQTEIAKRKAFFESEERPNKRQALEASFLNMNLSRPILRGITAAAYTKPTPVQAETIPIALNGKDIVGSAETGSGKTAAFLIPIFERLLYRDTRYPQTRVLIITPTRELAMQCHEVAGKLATYTSIRFSLAVGGLSLKMQEAELKLRPDVVIATPGRFIDHMRNSMGFAVDRVEILVIDEADRMLEDGFADELDEILKTIPSSRQTMLFSATMTSSVDRLIEVGLRNPRRITVDAEKKTVGTLLQRFLRIHKLHESKRMGYLIHLCRKLYKKGTIIFFNEKKQVHLTRIIFGLLGLSCAEIHGNMKQTERIASVEAFRLGKVSFLVASDVAARGLDIKDVRTVINYDSPRSHEAYLHRVGRTARAGRKGIACTFYDESERRVVRQIVKHGKRIKAQMQTISIDPAEASRIQAEIDDLEDTVLKVLDEEKMQKNLSHADMEVRKAENLIKHQDEIRSRPKRTWFQTENEKQLSKLHQQKTQGQESIQACLTKTRDKMKRRNLGKLTNKDKKRLDAKRERLEIAVSRSKKQPKA